MMPTEDIYQPLLNVIEFLGTFAFAISGIRHAAAKRFDWFGGFVCGVAVAIGGGTLRDINARRNAVLDGLPLFISSVRSWRRCSSSSLRDR